MKLFPTAHALLAVAASLPSAIGAANVDGMKSNSCACDAMEYGFNIDCSNTSAMNAAIATLEYNNCSNECNSSYTCIKNFLIIQSHHDYCFHEEVPEIIETNIHVYESVCTAAHCNINMKFASESRKCPPVDCETRVGDDAWQVMATSDCTSDCSSTDCANNFRIIKAVHDKCPRDTLSTVVEIAYHDVDEACNAFGCNLAVADTDQSQLICDDMSFLSAGFSASLTKALPTALVGGMAAAALL